MATRKEKSNAETLSFELALAKLEEIVHKLEDGELSLDEALSSYEAGIQHLKQCHRLLQAAERKISLLTELREDGSAVLESFAEEEMSLDQKQDSRAKRRSRTEPTAKLTHPDDVDTQKGLF